MWLNRVSEGNVGREKVIEVGDGTTTLSHISYALYKSRIVQ